MLGLGKIAAEIRDAGREHPYAAIGYFNLLENGRRRKLTKLRLRGLAFVGAECANVDESANPLIGSGPGDDLAAVGMPDEDCGSADTAQCLPDDGDVVGSRVERVLRRDTFIAGGLKRLNYFAEARAICQIPWQNTMLGLAVDAIPVSPFAVSHQRAAE